MNETINHLSNNLFDVHQPKLPPPLPWVNPLSTILIIDDSPVNHKLLVSQLREANYHILSVTSGPEGLQVVQSQPVDLIMLDVMMPGMDGFEVCRRLKSNPTTTDIPIIFLTALRDISYRLKGIEAGGDEFLSRPHNREELLLRVNSLIQLKRAREKLESERNHLQLLYNVNQAVLSQFKIEQIITHVVQYTQSAVGATKGMMVLINHQGQVTHKILVRAEGGTSVSDRVTQKVMSDGFAGWLWRTRQSALILDTDEDVRWVHLELDTDPAGSAIGVPLRIGEDEIFGVMMFTHSAKNYFRKDHLGLLETIAGQVTASLRSAHLFAEVNDELGRIELFNYAAEAMFHLGVSAVIGRTLTELPPLERIAPLFSRKEPVMEELGLDDGRILATSITPILGVGSIGVFQDVTERIMAEASRFEQERKEKEAIREVFGRYISPSLLDQVLPDTPEMHKRRKRWTVVLFADLRNHTQMIINMSADSALDLLNEFFNHMTPIIEKYEGTIIDIIGDEIEVGFNIPFDQPDAAKRALLVAVEMQTRFDSLRPHWLERANTSLGLGIGIDCGDVVVGNVGSPTRMNLAMVGQAVNTAHRLVDLAEDGQVIISADLYARLGTDLPTITPSLQPFGPIKIKGLEKPMQMYRATFARQALG